jgi:sRNA-binding protein
MSASYTQRVREYLDVHPNAPSKAIAEALGLTKQQVYTARHNAKAAKVRMTKNRKAANLIKAREALAEKRRMDAQRKVRMTPVVQHGEIIGMKPPEPQLLMQPGPTGWVGVWAALRRALSGK